MLVDGKWRTEDYNYCKEHDLYYRQYCLGCALYGCQEPKDKNNIEED